MRNRDIFGIFPTFLSNRDKSLLINTLIYSENEMSPSLRLNLYCSLNVAVVAKCVVSMLQCARACASTLLPTTKQGNIKAIHFLTLTFENSASTEPAKRKPQKR